MDALKPTAGNSYNYNSADSPHNLHNRPQGQNFEKVCLSFKLIQYWWKISILITQQLLISCFFLSATLQTVTQHSKDIQQGLDILLTVLTASFTMPQICITNTITDKNQSRETSFPHKSGSRQFPSYWSFCSVESAAAALSPSTSSL